MDDIQKTAIGADSTAQEAIEKAAEEYTEVDTEVPVSGGDQREVKAAESSQEFADLVIPSTGVEDDGGIRAKSRSSDGAGIRDIAYSKGEEVNVEVPEELKHQERTKQRMAEIEAVNEELKARGNKRRYVENSADAPETAHVFEDNFGKYYYEKVDLEVRPSTLAEYAEVKDVAVLDEDEAAVKALEFMADMYADPLIDAASKEAAESWLDRHFILASDDAGSDDVFSPEFKSQLAELVAQASAKDSESEEGNEHGGKTEKGRVYISDPSEAPEDAQVHEGDQGGYYYETEDGGEEGEDGDGGEEDGVPYSSEEVVESGAYSDALDALREEAPPEHQDYIEEAISQAIQEDSPESVVMMADMLTDSFDAEEAVRGDEEGSESGGGGDDGEE